MKNVTGIHISKTVTRPKVGQANCNIPDHSPFEGGAGDVNIVTNRNNSVPATAPCFENGFI